MIGGIEDGEGGKNLMGKIDPTVVFTPSGIRGTVTRGTSVLNAARSLGVDLDSVCGGRGICSKCQVIPGKGKFPKFAINVENDSLSDWNSVEERYKSKRGLAAGRRLGCQALINKDVVIDIPPESQIHKQVVRKEIDQRDIVLKPTIKVMYVEVTEPTMDEPTGDTDRVLKALMQQWNLKRVSLKLNLMSTIQKTLREGSWKITCILKFDYRFDNYEVIDITVLLQ